jgi:hypothetical protein
VEELDAVSHLLAIEISNHIVRTFYNNPAVTIDRHLLWLFQSHPVSLDKFEVSVLDEGAGVAGSHLIAAR